MRERGIRDQAAGARVHGGQLDCSRSADRERLTQDASQRHCCRMRPGAPLMPRWPVSLATAARGCCVWQPCRHGRLCSMTRRAKVANKSQPNLAFCHSGLPLACPTRQQACPFGGRVAWASRCFAEIFRSKTIYYYSTNTHKKRNLVEILVKVNLGVYFLLIKKPPSSNSSRLIEFFN